MGQQSMSEVETIYKVIFYQQGQTYELYAREVAQSSMYAFLEIGEFIFDERSQIVVDPSEERLKAEFGHVTRAYIPLHCVLRIDEVEKAGKAKIVENISQTGNVAQFPMPPISPKK